MKNDKEIKKLAKEIADLELKLQKAEEDKIDESVLSRIQYIMEHLTFEESLKLDEYVIALIGKN